MTLRRLNEVEIDQTNFSSVRGVQALVKDAVKNSIARINQSEFSWPFNYSAYTQVLVAGQEEYTWPSDYKIADWNSFQMIENSSLGSSYQKLSFITTDQWFDSQRDLDASAGSTGRSIPQYVFPSGSGWGLTPSPDKAYSVNYRYYKSHVDLVLYSDQTRVPTQFDNVIVDGAMFNMYMFKDNPQSAQLVLGLFEQGVKNMQSQLINQYDSIRDRRVVQGINTEFFNNA
tara:strand:+ start:1841 stop:2527 length:687 start_codon:yes stop_codon:yes gene_type:complete